MILDSNDMPTTKKKRHMKKPKSIKLKSKPISNGYFAIGNYEDAFYSIEMVHEVMDISNLSVSVDDEGMLIISEN